MSELKKRALAIVDIYSDLNKITEREANILREAITTDRPQGEWILLETDCDDGGNNLYECTNCHYSDTHSESVDVPFCWHCGAYMGGNKDETEN